MVILSEYETIDNALLRFKRQSGEKLEDYNRRRFYQSRTQRRRAKDAAAQRRRQKQRQKRH